MRKLTYDKSVITSEVLQSFVNRGFSRPQIAKHFGVSDYIIRRAESDYGISRPKRGQGRKRYTDVSQKFLEEHREMFNTFLSLHNQGLTYTKIAEQCGCSVSQVCKIMTVFGVSFSTAYKTNAAHNAIKGTKRTIHDLERRAIGKERKPPALSRWEALFRNWLVSQNIPFTISKAVGKYNLDFAVGDSIAVELFGGAFHSTGRAAARLHERMEYLINRGWNVYIIWCLSKETTIFPRCFDDFVTFMEQVGGNKASMGQYRVIWSDGDFISCGGRESDYLSRIKPPAFRHNALCKYKTTGD